MHITSDVAGDSLAFHRLSWLDFDELARGDIRADAVQRLRTIERSRRLLLLRALVDLVSKTPDLTGPFSAPEDAWELLARAEAKSPAAFNLVLAHPYTGSWVGYTTRLVRSQITGVCPLWVHVGHLHSLAAAAAIRAGLNFEIRIPLWDGHAILPTLGLVRLAAATRFDVAVVRGVSGQFEVRNDVDRVLLPSQMSVDGPGWWSIRRATTHVRGHGLVLGLDDLDPYRGLYEPVPPQRLDAAEVDRWRRLLDEAWHLVVTHVPTLAPAMAAGLDSLVPRPNVPLRNPSASTGEAFGSAVVGRPADAASLAATLIHEFQHIVLGGVLHVTRLYADDPRERFYAPWRDDPRPLSGALQGVYAHFGVALFWRAVAGAPGSKLVRRAAFEFAYWRRQAWRTLGELRDDACLTPDGRRFVGGIAEHLGPWQDESLPVDTVAVADTVAADHYAGWRIRHLRPHPHVVTELERAWHAGRPRPPAVQPVPDQPPTPVPDGSWSGARADLVRLALCEADGPTADRAGATSQRRP